MRMFAFFDRLSTGWTAARACVEVLKRDKKLVVFPLLSGVACLLVLASFAVPLAIAKPAFLKAVLAENADVHQAPPWFWAVLFTFYFVNYFVIYFFNSALVYCASPISAANRSRPATGCRRPVAGCRSCWPGRWCRRRSG